MNIMFKLTDEDLGLEPKKMEKYELRTAARGFVIRDDGRIAILNKALKNEYKLIGGGVEPGEDPITAFKREALEETGCEVEIIEELGITEEYRSLRNFKQLSYIFVAKVIKDNGSLALTEHEEDDDEQLLWVYPKEAIQFVKTTYDNLIGSDYMDLYESKFVNLKDRKLLGYYITKDITTMELQLHKAEAEEKEIVHNLMQLYTYELTFFEDETTSFRMLDNGFYSIDKYLSVFFERENSNAYILKCGDKLAGFVLQRINEAGFNEISEFFILKKYRKNGAGTFMANKMFEYHKGKWEIRTLFKNTKAQEFWRKVVNEASKRKI